MGRDLVRDLEQKGGGRPNALVWPFGLRRMNSVEGHEETPGMEEPSDSTEGVLKFRFSTGWEEKPRGERR